MTLPINAILVPQGAEYQAVCRGLSQISSIQPLVVPIPIGTQPVTQCLKQWLQDEPFANSPHSRVLVMGLCGSLSPRYGIGDIVLYRDCLYVPQGSRPQLQECDDALTNGLHRSLNEKASRVRAMTSDRMIESSSEKRQLNHIYKASVVDMEGFAVLDVLSLAGVDVAMVRVISDSCHQTLPNLNSTLSSEGSLKPFPLALGLLRQPLAATQLIQGALRGLRVLQQVTINVFSSYPE
ncbi:phosphorylase [Coleofasciculus sp. LEGE 07081]|nr:phosphorylase [Coleofasciculus sp. LEGE 07081]